MHNPLRRRTPEDISDTALAAIASEPPAAEPRTAAHERRGAMEGVLARKILQAHLDARRAAMRSRPSNLRDLPPQTATLLIRAMGAAGHADGQLDERERRRIERALLTTTLDEAGRAALLEELETPPCLESLARQVEDEDMAVRFYAVSIVTAERGRRSNQAYLTYVAARLGVPRDVVVRLNRRFDIPV